MRAQRRHIEIFLAAVDHGSTRGASDRLGMSSAAVLQGLRQLEAALGIELFQRGNRTFRLTEAGAAAVAPARAVLNAFDLLQDEVAGASTVDRGTLSVGTIPTLAVEPVAQLLGTYRRRHPGVRVSVHQTRKRSVAEVARAVRSGAVDVGVTELPTDTVGLRVLELRGQEFFAVLPRGTKSVRGTTIELASVCAHGLIVGPYWESSTAYSFVKAHAADVDAAVALRTDHRESFVYLAAEGLGAALVMADRAVVARSLGCQVLRVEPRMVRRTALLYRTGEPSARVRAFVQVCRDSLMNA